MDQELELLVERVGEDVARQVLAAVGRRSALVEFERVIIRRLAGRLLQERAPRWQIRDRLVSRGVNQRTAYRAIEAALNAHRPSCDTKAGALANGLPSIDASQHMESVMPLSIEDLKTKLAQLQTERDAIDLDALKGALDEAEGKVDADRKAEKGWFGRSENPEALANRRQQLGGAVTQARVLAREKTLRASQLDSEIKRLNGMLEAADRIEATRQVMRAAAEAVTSAQGAVMTAKDAVTKIQDLISDEERVYDTARSSAAAQLLAAVKSGGDQAAVPAPNRDRVGFLEIAKTSAEEELAAAKAALDAAIERHKVVQRDVLVAEAGATELQHDLAYHAYLDALTAHMVAYTRATRAGYGAPDVREEARARAHRILERLG